MTLLQLKLSVIVIKISLLAHFSDKLNPFGIVFAAKKNRP